MMIFYRKMHKVDMDGRTFANISQNSLIQKFNLPDFLHKFTIYKSLSPNF